MLLWKFAKTRNLYTSLLGVGMGGVVVEWLALQV